MFPSWRARPNQLWCHKNIRGAITDQIKIKALSSQHKMVVESDKVPLWSKSGEEKKK